MSVGAALLLTTAIFAAVIVAASGLAAAKVHYAVNGLLIVATFLLSLWIFWRAFEVGKRLKNADEGRSPFGRPSQKSELPGDQGLVVVRQQ